MVATITMLSAFLSQQNLLLNNVIANETEIDILKLDNSIEKHQKLLSDFNRLIQISSTKEKEEIILSLKYEENYINDKKEEINKRNRDIEKYGTLGVFFRWLSVIIALFSFILFFWGIYETKNIFKNINKDNIKIEKINDLIQENKNNLEKIKQNIQKIKSTS